MEEGSCHFDGRGKTPDEDARERSTEELIATTSVIAGEKGD